MKKLVQQMNLDLKHPPLYHQQRTYEALKANDLVINTYNTGTGKTRACVASAFRFEGRKRPLHCSNERVDSSACK